MLKSALLLAALLASTGALAAPTAPEQAATQAVRYEYGMDLDVVEVIQIAEKSSDGYCQSVDARMTYRDSHGELQAIDYSKQDPSCSW